MVQSTLGEFGLAGWPKTSGSRGIHIYIRIERKWDFQEVRRAGLALAREVERRAPELITTKWWKEERHGVFIDYNQNARDRTIAGAYSVRPTPDARVSAPLSWDEIDDCEPGDFTLATMASRLAASATVTRRWMGTQVHSRGCSSCRPDTSARGWAMRRGLRTTETARRASALRPRGDARPPPAHRNSDAHGKADAQAGLERWQARHAEASRISRPPTCWWTRCAAGSTPGHAFA